MRFEFVRGSNVAGVRDRFSSFRNPEKKEKRGNRKVLVRIESSDATKAGLSRSAISWFSNRLSARKQPATSLPSPSHGRIELTLLRLSSVFRPTVSPRVLCATPLSTQRILRSRLRLFTTTRDKKTSHSDFTFPLSLDC